MSDIWELKPQISECSLQINVVHHSPYHMKWIWYSLHQALGIFLQILHAISKHQLCCSIFYIKTFSKVVPSFDGVVWPFGNLFVSFFCAFGYLTFLSFVRETFLILWNVKRGIFLRLPFIAVYWCLTQCFAVLIVIIVIIPHYRHEQRHCVHLKVLQVCGFLLPLSLLKYFLSQVNWSLTELIFPS